MARAQRFTGNFPVNLGSCRLSICNATDQESDEKAEADQFTEKNWRRRPDLNRGWRFCRPLPYHLATAPSERLARGRGTLPALNGVGIRSTAFDEPRRTDQHHQTCMLPAMSWHNWRRTDNRPSTT